MARKKALGAGHSERDVRSFAVVLEDIRAQFGVFGEALQGLREQMEARFEAVDRRFDRTDHELGLVKTAVLENSRQLREHASALTDQGSS